MKEITIEELKQTSTPFQLIDVREQKEHNEKNIGGVCIPVSEILNNVHLISKDIPVVFYCKSGKRSGDVVKLLQFKFALINLMILKGGIG